MPAKDYYSWRDELYHRGLKKGDRRALRFLARYTEMVLTRFKDPRKTVRLADELLQDPLIDEYPWWRMLFRHYRLHSWIAFMGNLKKALPECVDALAVLDDPVYETFPQRHCLINDLVSIYMGMDPVGYYDEIMQKVKDELAVIPKDMGCRSCYLRDHLLMLRYGGDLKESEWIVDELTLEYTESPKKHAKEAKFRLYLNICEIFLARGRVDKAGSCLEKVQSDDLETPYRQAVYRLMKGYVDLRTRNGWPPPSVLHEAENVWQTGKKWGLDRLRWRGYRLAGDYSRESGFLRQSVDFYIKALGVLTNLGAYRDEAEIALAAAGQALECNHSGLPYCLERAEAANRQLKNKPFTCKIEQIRQCTSNLEYVLNRECVPQRIDPIRPTN